MLKPYLTPRLFMVTVAFPDPEQSRTVFHYVGSAASREWAWRMGRIAADGEGWIEVYEKDGADWLRALPPAQHAAAMAGDIDDEIPF